MTRWREVTKKNPCPVCGKPDWCSTLHADDGSLLVCCRRAPGGKEKIDKTGRVYWLYKIN